MKQSLVSPSFLRQKARQLKKEKSLSQSQALNEAARLLGFSNYKHYLNVLEASPKKPEPSKESFLQSIFLEKDIHKKSSLAISLMKKFKISFEDLFDILKHLRQSKETMQSVCEKSTLKDEIQNFLQKYFHADETKEELQKLPLKQHFVAKEVSVKNLMFRMDEEMLYAEGDYDLSLEFEFEVPEEDRHLPHFNRDPMFGDFEVTIDRRKEIAFVDSNLGEEFDGKIFMASFP